MSEEKSINPLILLLGGVGLLAVMVVGMLFLMKESPEDIIREFYACRDLDKQMMLLDNESAGDFARMIQYQAMSENLSVEAYKREYSKYCPTLKEVKSVESRAPDGSVYDITVVVTRYKSPEQELKFVVVKTGDVYKINLRYLQN